MSDENELGTIIEFSEDISTAEAPPPLPVREYRAQVKGAKAKKSQRQTSYAEVLFYISPEEYPADFTDGDPDGMTIAYRRCSLEDKANARFAVRKFCEALGAPRSKRIDLNDWVGLEALVKIEHETYEGITRGVISKVNPL